MVSVGYGFDSEGRLAITSDQSIKMVEKGV